ncbi:NAD(P)H-dependent oxidoreductase [Massilia sp. TWR1-2-2]|uniref:NAD(P)H-dependent oxidoreductase n=1 Tax=Massilia sp. TWR1-2-2 TaxID=2804584 RepID=UPI003CEBF143
MFKRVLLIQGHPDSGGGHLCGALEEAYARGAVEGGHELRRIDIAALDFPLLRSQDEWEHGPLPPTLLQSQQDILWSQHIVIFFPLWLGDMPAMLKGFLEQVERPGFAFSGDARNPFARKGLKGRSARLVVTMGMPAVVYRVFFRAHGVKSLRRSVLGFAGIAPVADTLIGMTGNMKSRRAARWLDRLFALGRAAV